MCVVVKDVAVLKLALEMLVSRNTKPMMTIRTSINSFNPPKRLFNQMPHFRDMLCSKHEKVLTAMAMPTTLPAVIVTLAAWSTATANATEFVAVFPNTRKEMPNKHVARYFGTLRK